ncbi:MAG TPA: hypothetical protein PLX35_10320 [Cyclobacteriaceae bacterium]|nr:hypothetical protein [Cyclobacteriaceae bacterium]
MRSTLLRALFLAVTLSFPLSCIHEPAPTCIGVELNVEATTTDPMAAQKNGTILVAAAGNSKYFTYSINGVDFQATSKFTGLDSGKYTITARNSWGCTTTTSVHLTRIDPCAGITLTATAKQPTTGLSDGTLTASLTNAQGYTFSLNNGTAQTSNVFTGLAAGNYTLVAQHTSNGCKFTFNTTLSGLDPCAGVTIMVSGTTTSPTLGQSDGVIVANATGGSGFSYSLNGGVFQSNNTFNGLAAGTYQLTAKSATGCMGTATITLSANNPCAGVTVVVTTTSTNPTTGLSDGTITATATGSNGFTYSINNGPFQSTGSFTGLASGNYLITAKSNTGGCTGTTQVALGSNNPCAGVTITVTGTVTGATTGTNNGSIAVTASGGTGFTYNINNGAYQTSGTFSNLAAGVYTIVAKSAAGCIGSAQFTVNSVNPCAGVTIAVTGTTTAASTGQSNGSITASASGATGLTYSINGGAFQATGSFTGLAAGSYTVTAKSAAGCTGSAVFMVGTINPCQNTTITLTATPTASNNCVTPGTGSIAASASGSTGFTYNINSGAYQSSATFTALSPATYTVGVKDANGCTQTTSVVVSTVAAGPKFTAVKNLVIARCGGSGCHLNGQTQKGYNFDTDCKIVSAWSGINGSCVTNTLTKMPLSPQPALTTAEKQAITDWVNAGHGFAN